MRWRRRKPAVVEYVNVKPVTDDGVLFLVIEAYGGAADGCNLLPPITLTADDADHLAYALTSCADDLRYS